MHAAIPICGVLVSSGRAWHCFQPWASNGRKPPPDRTLMGRPPTCTGVHVRATGANTADSPSATACWGRCGHRHLAVAAHIRQAAIAATAGGGRTGGALALLLVDGPTAGTRVQVAPGQRGGGAAEVHRGEGKGRAAAPARPAVLPRGGGPQGVHIPDAADALQVKSGARGVRVAAAGAGLAVEDEQAVVAGGVQAGHAVGGARASLPFDNATAVLLGTSLLCNTCFTNMNHSIN
eukprot:CAMPEP_0194566694 /NCGR_PEP_ID=MMETSP0292-20121207/5471_1 /TAXON_ID=39354 /ORGANISM="Heterosigma akashiwo, Strain CCMP2393" /LENGTH=234 /DNA_ID=CAMNT_0039416323 /DNA_START=520 /DNA_END=1224 /DNA_ORIENTATION=-